MPSLESDYPRYLAAKHTVDDRAVNERVLRRLAAELKGKDRVRVLNVGAGIGGVVERLVERDVFPTNGSIPCTLVDVREENVAAARERLHKWARSQDYTVTDQAVTRPTDEPATADGPTTDDGPAADGTDRNPGFRIEDRDRTIDVEVLAADAFEVAERGEWDLLVGQAFLDLFDVGEVLPRLLPALAPGGLCYFPITFDGGTIFEPAVDCLPSGRLQRAFHAHIDRNGGDPRAGRHLLTRLPREGVEIVAAGSSDWVVHARDGADAGAPDSAAPDERTYPAEEGAFLRFIVDTVADALVDEEECGLAPETLREWRRSRHVQIDHGDLVYVAHQLDVLGRVRGSGNSGSA